MDINLILEKLRPGSEYGKLGKVIDENDYDMLINWRDTITLKPTWIEIKAERPVIELSESKRIKEEQINAEIFKRTFMSLTTSQSTLLRQIAPGLTSSNLGAGIQKDISILNYGLNKIDTLNAETDKTIVDSYDPATDPSFPK